MKTKKPGLFLAFAALTLVFFSCVAGAGGSTSTSQNPVTSIRLQDTHINIAVGQTSQLRSPTISPSNAENKDFDWKAKDPGIASISPTGLLRGVSAGTTVITVTAKDGNHSDSISVTVISNSNNGGPVRVVAEYPTEKIFLKPPAGNTEKDVIRIFVIDGLETGVKTVTASGYDTSVVTIALSETRGIYSSFTLTALKPGITDVTFRSVADSTKTTSVTITVTDDYRAYEGTYKYQNSGGTEPYNDRTVKISDDGSIELAIGTANTFKMTTDYWDVLTGVDIPNLSALHATTGTSFSQLDSSLLKIFKITGTVSNIRGNFSTYIAPNNAGRLFKSSGTQELYLYCTITSYGSGTPSEKLDNFWVVTYTDANAWAVFPNQISSLTSKDDTFGFYPVP